MTALAAEKTRKREVWKYKQFTLASGTKAYKGGLACIDKSSATSTKVVPGTPSSTLVAIGVFRETVDATSAAALVDVDLLTEIEIEWWANGTSTDAVAATDIGKDAYVLDDQTVSILSGGHSLAGRIWAYDSVKNLVAVQKTGASGDGLLPQPTLIAYVSNDSIPTTIVNRGIYDVPTTGAASTVTLPAAAPDGTIAYFAADGTKNGHTVQYRDATGPTNLTTALTASKRHLVVASKLGGKWFANAYVSP
jgi:hypothetical protein